MNHEEAMIILADTLCRAIEATTSDIGPQSRKYVFNRIIAQLNESADAHGADWYCTSSS